MFSKIEGLKILPALVCRSTDRGHTWERGETVQSPPGKLKSVIPVPFGDIIRLNGGSLGVACCSIYDHHTYFIEVLYNGRNLIFQSYIQKNNVNETTLLSLDNRRLMAAAHMLGDQHYKLFFSYDMGNTWINHGPLTHSWQHPLHLLRLADDRILLVYGIRCKHNKVFQCIGACISEDQGNSWSEPRVLVELKGATDGGYPSSIRTKNDIIVTAYYCNWLKFH